MACVKKYFAPDGTESSVFNNLRDVFGENVAEVVYLMLHTDEFKNWYGDWVNGKTDNPLTESGEPALFWNDGSSQVFQKNRYEGAKPYFIKHNSQTEKSGFIIPTATGNLIVSSKSTNLVKGAADDVKYTSLFRTYRMQRRTPSEIENNIIESSSRIEPAGKSDYYIVGGRPYLRVTRLIDRVVPYRGDPSGTMYEDSGTRYHEIAKDIVDGMTESQIMMKYSIQPFEERFVRELTKFIDSLRRDGSKLIAEARFASSQANNNQGVACSIDILRIKPDGKAVIYDFKTANETPSKRRYRISGVSKEVWDISDYNYYKAERYTHQFSMYEQIVSSPDPVTGRLPVEVDAVYAVPIEIYRNDNQEVVGIKLLSPENVKKWKAGRISFYNEAKNWAKSIVYGHPSGTFFTGVPYTSDVNTLLPNLLGFDIREADLSNSAKKFVENHSHLDEFYINGVKYTWVSNNKTDRINQIESLFRGNRESTNEEIFKSVRLFLNDSPSRLFSFDEKKSSPAATRLRKVLEEASAEDVIQLSSIRGFEEYDDVIIIKRSDGMYDLLKLTYKNLNARFNIKNKDGNVIRVVTGTDTKSIFGNLITPSQSRDARISLENTYGDYERLRLGLLAYQLESVNPDFRVNRIIVDNLVSNSLISPIALPLNVIGKHLDYLFSIKSIQPLINSNIRSVANHIKTRISDRNSIDENVNAAIDDLLNWMENNLDDADYKVYGRRKNVRVDIKDILTEYKNDSITKDELLDQLMDSVLGLKRLLRYKYSGKDDVEDRISSDPEMMRLAKLIVALKNSIITPEKDLTKEFFGFISIFIKSPSSTGRQLLDKAIDSFRQMNDRAKRELVEIIDKKNVYVKDMLKELSPLRSGFGSRFGNVGGSDVIYDLSPSVFKGMLKRGVTREGVEYIIPELIEENSAEWHRLTDAQKKFLKFFKSEIKKLNPDWNERLLPLMHVSSKTLAYRSRSQIKDVKFMKGFSTAFSALATSFKNMKTRGNYSVDDQIKAEVMETKGDYFRSLVQYTDTGVQYKSEVLEEYGLDENYNLLDPDKNSNIEDNLEIVFTKFAEHYIKKKWYDKALVQYNILRSIFKIYEMSYGFDQKDTIQYLDAYFKDLVFNIKLNEDANLSTLVNVAVRSSSLAMLLFKPHILVGNVLQMYTSGFLTSLTTWMSGDRRYFKTDSLAKAVGEMTKAMNPVNKEHAIKLMLILKEYMPPDMPIVTGKLGMSTSRGLLNEQLQFMIDRLAEYSARTVFIVAQMIEDGVYDAHSVQTYTDENGKQHWRLVYDPSKDKRFMSADGQLLKQAIMESMRENDELDENGNMVLAYDWKLRNRLAAHINSMIGTVDRDLSSHMMRFGVLFGISQMRSWFRDLYVRSTKHEYLSEVMGDYVKIDGKYVWSPDTMKGILWTLADLYSIGKRLAKGEKISMADKRNLIFTVNSLAFLALMFATVAHLWDDDDDDKPKIFEMITARYYGDILSFLTLQPFASITTDPLLFVVYYNRLFKTIGRSIAYGIEGESDKAFDAFMKVLPVVNQFDLYDFETD